MTEQIDQLREISREEGDRVLSAAGYRVVDKAAAELNGERSSQASELELQPVADIAAAVKAAPPRTFLVKHLIVAAQYGVIGGAAKAGKTFDALDLAVSVNTGTPWFDLFECPTMGPVALYLGEGDKAGMLRRLDAIVRSRGGELGDLGGLQIAFRVPRLSNADHIRTVRADLARLSPVLCVIDPLYISAGGAKAGSVFDMGELLAPIQEVCQQQGATLVVIWHWNQTGQGTGPQRFTGAGAWEWARFLGSAAVERRAIEAGGASVIQSRWEWSGSELPDMLFRVSRRIWPENPDDPNSPLHYDVEASPEELRATDGLSPGQRRVLSALQDVGPPGIRVREIGDRIAGDRQGPPLQRRTIQKALKDLAAEGLVDGEQGDVRGPGRWWSVR